MAMTKKEKDTAIRAVGLAKVDTEELTQTGTGTFVGMTEIEGEERFYEIKVVVKSDEYTYDELEGILRENEIKEKARVEREEKAAAKKAAALAKKSAKEAEKAAKAAKE